MNFLFLFAVLFNWNSNAMAMPLSDHFAQCEEQLIQEPPSRYFAQLLTLITSAKLEEIETFLQKNEKPKIKPHEADLCIALIGKIYPELGLKYWNHFFSDEQSLLQYLTDFIKDKQLLTTVYQTWPRWNLSSEGRYKLALLVASGFPNEVQIQSFLIESEEQRADILIRRIEAGWWPSSHDGWRKEFNIQLPESFAKVLISFAKQSTRNSTFFNNFKNDVDSLPQTQKNKLALIAATNIYAYPNDFVSSVQFFKLTDRDIIKEFFIAAMVSQIESASSSSFNFSTGFTKLPWKNIGRSNAIPFQLSSKEAVDTLIEILSRISLQHFKKVKYREKIIEAWFGDNLISEYFVLNTHSLAEKLLKIYLERTPVETIANFALLESLEGLHLMDDENGAPGLIPILRSFSEKFPNYLPSPFVEALWDRVKNEEVVLRLIREYFAHHNGVPKRFANDSRDILCEVTGLSACIVKESEITEKNPNLFYELLLDIQRSLKYPAFSGIEISAESFKKKPKLLDFLQSLRDLLIFTGKNDEAWKKIIDNFNLKGKIIDSDRMQNLTEQVRKLLIKNIQNQLGESEKGSVQFSYDQFQRLTNEWGDLEPIYTLLARFGQRDDWKKEIPVLIEVFKASIEDRFSELKFQAISTKGEEYSQEARGQMYGLALPKRFAEWRKPRYRVSVYGENETQSADLEKQRAQIMPAAKEIIKANILPHIASDQGADWLDKVEITAEQSEWIENFLRKKTNEDIHSQDPAAVAEEMVKSLPGFLEESSLEVKASFLFQVAMKELQKSQSELHIRGNARLLRTLITLYPDLGFKQQKDQLRADFKALEKLASIDSGAKQGKQVILTVLNADPKFLLTIGDLVKTSSCQNYKTGSHIETLLGYVIDANVQAVASFSLNQGDFFSFADYTQVTLALEQNIPVDVSWNGNKRVATFTLSNENGKTQVTSRVLKQAYLRQMIKVGATAKQTPGVRLEKEYLQTHAALEIMRKQHQEILKEIVDKVDGDSTSVVTISRSRNPGGHYSDLGGGVKTDEYTIK